MEYNELIAEYKQNRFNKNKSNSIIKKIELNLNTIDDPLIKANLLYISGEHYYLFNNGTKSKKCLLEAINIFKHLPVCGEYIGCFNLLGALYDLRDDNSAALEYYLMGIKIFLSTGNYQYANIACALYNNIGSEYLMNDDIKYAIRYYRLALNYIKKIKNHKGAGLFTTTHLNLANAYCRSRNLKMAIKEYNILSNLDRHTFKANKDLDLLMLKSLILCMQNNRLELESCTIDLRQQFSECHLIEYVRIITQNVPIWLESKQYELCKDALDFCKRILENEKNIKTIYRYYFARALYYEKISDGANLAKYSIKYLHANEQAEIIKRQNQVSALNDRFDVYHLNDKLTLATDTSQTDELTGLFNRRVLDGFIKERFELYNAQNVGVALIDLDNFKAFNDNFGHLAGDKCLALVSAKLIDLCDNNTIAIRYGGDEFMLVFYAMDIAIINERLEQLRAQIDKLHLDFEQQNNFKLTLTIGVYNSIPKVGDSIYDYVSKADQCLYCGKIKRNQLIIQSTI